MSNRRIYLTDADMIRILEISHSTLSRIIHGVNRDGRYSVDLRKANPQVVGCSRRWKVDEVARVLRITPDEIMARLS